MDAWSPRLLSSFSTPCLGSSLKKEGGKKLGGGFPGPLNISKRNLNLSSQMVKSGNMGPAST